MGIAKETITSPRSLALMTLAVLGCRSATADGPMQQQAQHEPSAVELRAQGPQGLQVALDNYDRLPAGRAKDAQARIVDQVAAQRYATSSRLYWYTDLDEAKSAAKGSGTPILSLRLLGRLDEDYSCANSRMFRTVLYANEELSEYLRQNFTLHWSSERAVPKLTVDYGDGRILKSTVAGNSAHYLLTSDGIPVDVLPGLYSPKAFHAALEPSRKLANRLRGSKNVLGEIRTFHARMAKHEASAYEALNPQQRMALLPYRSKPVGSELLAAEMLTLTKSSIETAVALSLSPPSIGAPNATAVRDSVSKVEALDERSRRLIQAIGPTDWGAVPETLRGDGFSRMMRALERNIAGDTLINRHGLHPLIHKLFAQDAAHNFETLNTMIYADVFITPAHDPWLGMADPQGFTGLPGDGLVVR